MCYLILPQPKKKVHPFFIYFSKKLLKLFKNLLIFCAEYDIIHRYKNVIGMQSAVFGPSQPYF